MTLVTVDILAMMTHALGRTFRNPTTVTRKGQSLNSKNNSTTVTRKRQPLNSKNVQSLVDPRCWSIGG